jgi:hypothetical protein
LLDLGQQICKLPSATKLLQVHPEHGRSKLHITNELLAKHGDDDGPLTFWQVSCPDSCLLRKAVLRILSGKATALGVERLWSAARITLTDNRRSMLMSRLMQPLKCKLNVGLLEDSVFLDKLCVKLLEDGLEFQSIFNDLLQFEEQEQIEEQARLQLAQQGRAEEDEEASQDDDALVVAEDEEFDVFAD